MTRLLVALALVLVATPAAARRFVIAIGENHGDPGQPVLKFALDDAASFVGVMTELGGVRAEDTMVVNGTTGDGLRAMLASARLRLETTRFDELVVYVSSHAAEGSLRLRGTRYPLTELKRFADDAPVEVATVVLDVCQAGWLVRDKGLEPVARTLTVEPAEVRGRVFIMSSGATEAAEESDGIGGSTFTHHLVAGLRGPADTSRDGVVTLHEAFGYAHHRTLEASLGAAGGRQTPRFDIELQGQRELVLTELARAAGTIAIVVPQAGEWLVTPARGATAARRFVKGFGPVIYALAPGSYRVATIEGDVMRAGTITITAGRRVTIGASELVGWERTSMRSKGGIVDWTMELGPQVGTAAVSGVDPFMPGVVVALGRADSGWIGPLTYYEVTAGLRVGSATAELGRFDQLEIDVGLGLGPQWALPGWRLRAGLAAGVVVVRQSGGRLPTRAALLPRAELTAEAMLALSAPWFIGLRIYAGGQWVTTEDDDGARVRLGLVLTLGLEL